MKKVSYTPRYYYIVRVKRYINREFVPETAIKMISAIDNLPRTEVPDCPYGPSTVYVKVDDVHSVVIDFYNECIKSMASSYGQAEEIVKNRDNAVRKMASEVDNSMWNTASQVWNQRTEVPVSTKNAEAEEMIEDLEEALSRIQYSINQLRDKYDAAYLTLKALRKALKK
jgi:hypothetical protein